MVPAEAAQLLRVSLSLIITVIKVINYWARLL